MKNAFIYILVCTLTLGLNINTYAQTNDNIQKKNFVGLGIGQSYLNLDDSQKENQTTKNLKDTRSKFWNIYTGHKITESFSIKAEYLKLADIQSNQQNNPQLKIRAMSVSALGFYPLARRTSIFGETGLYTYRSKQTVNNNLTQTKGTKPFVGVGLKYDLGKTDLIIKYSHYGKVKNDYYKGNLGQVAFNIEYKF